MLKSTYINGFDNAVTVFENIVSTKNENMKINPYKIGPSPTAYVSFDKDNDIDKDTWDGLANGIGVKATTVDNKVHAYVKTQKMQEERRKKRRQRNKKDTDHLSTEIDVKILKIDCEGCEFDAFLSSLNVIRTYRPDILIEVCPYVFTRCHTTLKDEQAVWNNLYNLKYNIYIYFHERDIPLDFKRNEKIKLKYFKETLLVTPVPLNNHNDLKIISKWIEREKERNACFQLYITKYHLTNDEDDDQGAREDKEEMEKEKKMISADDERDSTVNNNFNSNNEL